MGYLYGSFYDYNKAVNILREAYQVSKRCNYTSNLAYVALNMGGIYLNCNMLYGKQLFSDEIWRQLSQAMSSGIKVRDYEVVMVSFLNMCTLYPDDPQDEKILHAISQLEGLRISDSQPLKAYSLCMALGIKSYIRHDYRGPSVGSSSCPRRFQPNTCSPSSWKTLLSFRWPKLKPKVAISARPSLR